MFSQMLPLFLVGFVACAPPQHTIDQGTSTVAPDMTHHDKNQGNMMQGQGHLMGQGQMLPNQGQMLPNQGLMQPGYQGQQFVHPGQFSHGANMGQPLILGQQQVQQPLILNQQQPLILGQQQPFKHGIQQGMSTGQHFNPMIREGVDLPVENQVPATNVPLNQVPATTLPLNTQTGISNLPLGTQTTGMSAPAPQTIVTHQPVLTTHPIGSTHQPIRYLTTIYQPNPYLTTVHKPITGTRNPYIGYPGINQSPYQLPIGGYGLDPFNYGQNFGMSLRNQAMPMIAQVNHGFGAYPGYGHGNYQYSHFGVPQPYYDNTPYVGLEAPIVQ